MSKQKRKENRSKRGGEQAEPNSRPEAAAGTGRKRRWVFRLIAVFLVPWLLMGILELGLRLFGYGYATSFFKPVRFQGREFLVNNDDFSLRFFPPQMARQPRPFMIEAKKAANTCRIFILGESAAEGDPAPPYGVGRYLEVLLRQRFPQENFEVVNVAITAVNSHVILPIARECAVQPADFWIVYMGNNEMVGPFGAATVFGPKAPALWLIRLNLLMKQTALGQGIAAIRGKLQKEKSSDASTWGGMEMFVNNRIPSDDSRKEVVYESFRRNLAEILQLGRQSGAKLILNTVAVNVKDCPPFATAPLAGPSVAEPSRYGRWYADGRRAQEEGRLAEAVRCYEEAAQLQPRSAELQFNWGQCLLQMSNFAEAGKHLQTACDEDELPFRADARINDLIRKTARQCAGPNLVLYDAAVRLATHEVSGICGQELFYEHVHFNDRGNYLLARAWAGEIEASLPPAVKRGALAGWATREACERKLGLTDWNRSSIDELLIQRFGTPPLSGQSNNSARLQSLRRDLAGLRRHMDAEGAGRARELYREAVASAPDDHWVRENFAEFLAATGDFKGAAEQWQKVCESMPFNGVACFEVGWLSEQRGEWAGARSGLLRALALRPGMAEAWFELGNVDFAEKKYEAALEAYRRAGELQPGNIACRLMTGKTLAELNRHGEAIEKYQQAIRLQPDLWEAHSALGDELVAANRIREAAREFGEVVRLEPGNVRAHVSLGVMLVSEGQLDEAQRELDAALKLEPQNQMVREYLEKVQLLKSERFGAKEQR